MFFLDSEHVGMGKLSLTPPRPPPSQKKKKEKRFLFMLDAWFQKIILIAYDFFAAAIISYVVKFYL